MGKQRTTNPENSDSHTISYIITRRVIRSEIGKQATFKQKQERIPETWFMRLSHRIVHHHTPCGSSGKRNNQAYPVRETRRVKDIQYGKSVKAVS